MSAINDINIDLVNPVAENSSPVDVTVAVEGTVSPPAPPTNITATAVASTSRKTITEVGLSLRATFHDLQPSPNRGICSYATQYFSKQARNDSAAVRRLRPGPF